MTSPDIVILNGSNFDQEITRRDGGPILVDFWAEWCGPCRLMAPVLDKVATRYRGKARVGKVDVDQNQTLAARYGVLSIPTLILFKEGKILEQTVGTTSEDRLAQLIDRHTG
jgi:thioredoxin 1